MPNHRRLDATQEAEAVSRYIAGEPVGILCGHYGVCDSVIYGALDRVGAARQKKVPPEVDPAAIVAAYRAGTSVIEIGRQTGAHRNRLAKILNSAGIEIRQGYRSHTLNESAFADAESNPEAAYWVGLIAADGCISLKPPRKTAWMLSISLSGDDGPHLFRLRDFLRSSHPIHVRPSGPKKPSSSHALSIANNRLVDVLMRYGITARKSHTMKVVHLENSPDYWRGYVDGDGYMRWVANDRSKPYAKIGLVGSLPTIEQFMAFAGQHVETGAKPQRHASIWKWETKRTAAVGLVRLLYRPMSVALPRKLAKAELILRQYGTSQL